MDKSKTIGYGCHVTLLRTQMRAKFWYRNTKKRDNFKGHCHKWGILKGTFGRVGGVGI